MTTIAAAPTVVPKSAAICGSSESATRTSAWLAKLATASSTIARIGRCGRARDGHGGPGEARTALTASGVAGFLPRDQINANRKSTMIDKTYQPAEVEGRIYAAWEEARRVPRRPARARRRAEPYCIVIPPPNVTGSLHMGHALNNTLQDILCRFERMRGKDVLWQPGTDHAGIATQMVVERQLMERQEPGRRDMGREKFLERVWAWKAESGGTIINQLKRLGASCDWSRERFTMDEGLSQRGAQGVRRALQRGPDLQGQAAGQLGPEAAHRDLRPRSAAGRGARAISGTSTIRSRARDEFIIVATTRPETMLGDTAVAVHPDDERYKHLIGKNAILPLVGRRIPIVADEYADPEKGTGAVKITPAHDFNDFEVGKRHNLPQVNVLDVEGKLTLHGQRGVPRRRAVDAGARRDAEAARRRPLQGAQGDRRAAGDGGLPRQDRAAHPHGAARRPLQRGDRAVPHRPVVRRRQDAGGAGDRRGARGQDQLRAEELGEDLFRLDGEHPAVVHLAPALVGPSDSGLVRAGRQGVRRRDRGRGGLPRARLLHARPARSRDAAGARHGARIRTSARRS